jgi:thioredoxin reductase
MTTPAEAERAPGSGNVGDCVDVVVVGGGLAGLGAALTLGRARRSVLVIDAGHPRNAPAAHSHGYLTRDGTPPLELLRLGRQEIRGYGGRIIEGTVETITRLDDGRFRLTTREGTGHEARRVLVTTGLVDEYPDIPGLRERWGRDVVHCPYCFGWEHRDRAFAVLGTGPGAATQPLMWRQWSEDVVLLQHTAPEPAEEEWPGSRPAASGACPARWRRSRSATTGSPASGSPRARSNRARSSSSAHGSSPDTSYSTLSA